MLLRTLDFAMKSFNLTAGQFTGRASTYGNIDQGGDEIAQGAFRETLQASGGKILLLDSHDMRARLGLAYLRDAMDGLHVKAVLSDTQRAVDMMKDLSFYDRMGYRLGLSIGYFPKSARNSGTGHRILTSIDLREASIVSMPMNELALIDGVQASSAGDEDGADELTRLLQDIHAYMRDIRQAPKAAPVKASDEDDLREAKSFLTQVRMWKRGLA